MKRNRRRRGVFLCAALMLLLRPSLIDARIGVGMTSLLTISAG